MPDEQSTFHIPCLTPLPGQDHPPKPTIYFDRKEEVWYLDHAGVRILFLHNMIVVSGRVDMRFEMDPTNNEQALSFKGIG